MRSHDSKIDALFLAAALALSGCSTNAQIADSGVGDAGADVASPCPVTASVYCSTHSCPTSLADAVSTLCAQSGSGVYVCGNSVAHYAIDIGSGYDFDDAGALTTIVSDNNGALTCVAGPVDAGQVGLCSSGGGSVCVSDAAAV